MVDSWILRLTKVQREVVEFLMMNGYELFREQHCPRLYNKDLGVYVTVMCDGRQVDIGYV